MVVREHVGPHAARYTNLKSFNKGCTNIKTIPIDCRQTHAAIFA